MLNKKIFFLFILCLLTKFGFSQKIELVDGIAYIDDIKYVKVEKISKNKFYIKNVDTNDSILEIKLFKSYNTIDKRTHKLPRIFFNGINETIKFESDIQSEIELVKFLFTNKLIFIDGKLNEKMVYEYLDYIKDWKANKNVD